MKKYQKIDIVKKDKEKKLEVYQVDLNALREFSHESIKRILKEYKAVPIRLLSENERGIKPLEVALSEELEEYELEARVSFMEFNLHRPIKAYIAPKDQIKDAIKLVKKRYKKYCK